MRQVSGVLSFRYRVRVRSVARITHYRRDLSHPVPTTIAHGRGKAKRAPGVRGTKAPRMQFPGESYRGAHVVGTILADFGR